jgi:predicted TPR repeat methyltransferase
MRETVASVLFATAVRRRLFFVISVEEQQLSHFNDKAKEWDDEAKVTMMKALAAKTLHVLSLNRKIDILDFGCGTGLFGLELADHARRLVGIDISEGMLVVFDKKTRGHAGIESRLIDLEKDSCDDRFDLIVTSMAFHHLNDPKAMVQKFRSMLNPGGRLAVVDLDQEDGSFHPDPAGMGVRHYGFRQDEIADWARAAGLQLDYRIINTIRKNDRDYPQFLAVMQA